MQPVDLTVLLATCCEIGQECLPAKLERVVQRDRHTLYLCLRTLSRKVWLCLSWHPQAARLHISDPPSAAPDTFTFSQQIWHQVAGLALVSLQPLGSWERVVALQFAKRPGDRALWHLYLEVMGKYSNAILVDAEGRIVTAAHQVSDKQSSVRPIQTGDLYVAPPPLCAPIPSAGESFEAWRDRLALLPQPVTRALRENYRGLSSALARSLLRAAALPPDCTTDTLGAAAWTRLFGAWQHWLSCLARRSFAPAWLPDGGYTAIASAGMPIERLATSMSALLQAYYGDRLAAEEFRRLHQQLRQVASQRLGKLATKAEDFRARLAQSDRADELRARADLLMAHLHCWQPGMTAIALPDFQTGEPVAIALDPQRTGVQNAQALYKQHQKQKRARQAIAPLLAEVTDEQQYLDQVDAALERIKPGDLDTLQEIRDELREQGYLPAEANGREKRKAKKDDTPNVHRYRTPNSFEVWVGRNNYHNDWLAFRAARDRDLWFHAQDIPGSHVLLRVDPGFVPDDADLQFAANLAAYYSRACQSDRVPVVCVRGKHVFKPKGAKPGMAAYRHECVLWGEPLTLGDRLSDAAG